MNLLVFFQVTFIDKIQVYSIYILWKYVNFDSQVIYLVLRILQRIYFEPTCILLIKVTWKNTSRFWDVFSENKFEFWFLGNFIQILYYYYYKTVLCAAGVGPTVSHNASVLVCRSVYSDPALTENVVCVFCQVGCRGLATASWSSFCSSRDRVSSPQTIWRSTSPFLTPASPCSDTPEESSRSSTSSGITDTSSPLCGPARYRKWNCG